MLSHPTLAVAVIEKGRIRETNPAWRSLFALPLDIAVESHVATLFPNRGVADRFERALQAALIDAGPASGGGTVVAAAGEQTLIRRDGAPFFGEVVVTLLDLCDVDRPLGGDGIWQIRDVTVERALRRELRDLEDYHRELSRHQSDMTFVIDRKGRIAYASASVEEGLGYGVNTLLGEPFVFVLDPAHAAEAEQWLRAASRRHADGRVGSEDEFALHVRHGSGALRVLACRPRDCFDIPRVAGMVIHARTVTDDKAADVRGAETATRTGEFGSALIALVQRFRAPASAAGADTTVRALVDAVRTRLDASAAVFRPVKGDDGAATGQAFGEVRSTRDSSAAAALVEWPVPAAPTVEPPALHVWTDVDTDSIGLAAERLHAAGIAALIEVPVHEQGTVVGWLAVGASEPRRWTDAETGFVVGVSLLLADAVLPMSPNGVSDSPPRLASGDALTGLPDRRAASDALTTRAAVPDGGPCSVVLVDVDRLRDINTSRGLDIGDAVVRKVADVLVEAASGAFVGRVDGGTFVVIVDGVAPRDVEGLAATLVGRIAGIANADGTRVAVDASVGLVHMGVAEPEALSPMLQAELALFEAKARGGGRVVVYSAKLAADLRVRRALDAEIEGALARDELTIFYQPQIALRSGAVVGLEALVRWQHPVRGLLLPDAFMDVAFDRGLIDAITKAVLTQVCGQIANWRREGVVPELPVSVNVSGRQFHDRRLPALVASALLKSGLPARLLVLEITEQSLVGDDAEVDRVVKELSRLGVRISIGDFNVGQASFRYLRQLRVSQVKLDRGFVRQLPHDAESVIVVGAVVEVAKRLKYQVIAEGVETQAQYEHLRSIGCEVGQGFHFGAPSSADDIRAYLVSRTLPPARQSAGS